jgi:hypothetical protein
MAWQSLWQKEILTNITNPFSNISLYVVGVNLELTSTYMDSKELSGRQMDSPIKYKLGLGM